MSSLATISGHVPSLIFTRLGFWSAHRTELLPPSVAHSVVITMKASLALLLAPVAALAAPALDSRQAAQSIDKLFKAKGKLYYGTCTDQGRLTSGKNAAIIEANFGQVTPENSMKWQSINNQQGSYSWGQADYLVNWATERNKTIRGHTFVWHSQLAGWVNNIRDKAQLTKVIQDHITTVMTRYKGKIYGYVRFPDYTDLSSKNNH